MLLNITYNRSAKQYEVAYTPTATATFKNRDKAIQFTVAAADRRIAQAIIKLKNNWPALESRAWRAAVLYLSDNVSKTKNGFTVKSQTRTGKYHINQKLQSCTCPDCQKKLAPHGPGSRHWCKHMLACSLSIRFPKLTHINGRHRTRSTQQSFIQVPTDHYQNGHPIEPNLINYAATFRASTGHPPADKELLISWIYR
jgi:hypothetical protein